MEIVPEFNLAYTDSRRLKKKNTSLSDTCVIFLELCNKEFSQHSAYVSLNSGISFSMHSESEDVSV